MPNRIYLRSIEVLQNLDAGLSQFNSSANAVLENTACDIKASQERLKARMTYWQAELRRRQNAYEACQHRGRSNCRTEALAVQQAQEAIEKLQRLSSRLEQAIGEYKPHANRLQQLLGSKLGKAKGDLRRSIQKYQSYLVHQGRSFASSIRSSGKTDSSQTQLKFGELDPNAMYDLNGYEYQTDELGRVNFVSGKLKLEKGVRTGHQTEVGKLGLQTDEGGHWIGTRFDGPPEGFNLFPQNANFNKGVYKSMEKEWANALAIGKRVEVAIQPVYLEDNNRPIGVDIYYVINGRSTTKVFFNEPKGGVK